MQRVEIENNLIECNEQELEKELEAKSKTNELYFSELVDFGLFPSKSSLTAPLSAVSADLVDLDFTELIPDEHVAASTESVSVSAESISANTESVSAIPDETIADEIIPNASLETITKEIECDTKVISLEDYPEDVSIPLVSSVQVKETSVPLDLTVKETIIALDSTVVEESSTPLDTSGEESFTPLDSSVVEESSSPLVPSAEEASLPIVSSTEEVLLESESLNEKNQEIPAFASFDNHTVTIPVETMEIKDPIQQEINEKTQEIPAFASFDNHPVTIPVVEIKDPIQQEINDVLDREILEMIEAASQKSSPQIQEKTIEENFADFQSAPVATLNEQKTDSLLFSKTPIQNGQLDEKDDALLEMVQESFADFSIPTTSEPNPEVSKFADFTALNDDGKMLDFVETPPTVIDNVDNVIQKLESTRQRAIERADSMKILDDLDEQVSRSSKGDNQLEQIQLDDQVEQDDDALKNEMNPSLPYEEMEFAHDEQEYLEPKAKSSWWNYLCL